MGWDGWEREGGRWVCRGIGLGGWRWAWIFPKTWGVWRVGSAGYLAADNPSYHRIPDSIGTCLGLPIYLAPVLD